MIKKEIKTTSEYNELMLKFGFDKRGFNGHQLKQRNYLYSLNSTINYNIPDNYFLLVITNKNGIDKKLINKIDKNFFTPLRKTDSNNNIIELRIDENINNIESLLNLIFKNELRKKKLEKLI